MRLPEHQKAGLLRRTLQNAHFFWLQEVVPEDFQQECELFLLDWSPEAVDADPKAFFRAASRHFYRMAVNYGFRRNRGASAYTQDALLDPLSEKTEDGYEKKVAVQSWISREGDFDKLQDCLGFCKNLLSETERRALRAYLSGYNLSEIAFLTGWKVNQVRRHLGEIISRLRVAAGVKKDFSLPPMPR